MYNTNSSFSCEDDSSSGQKPYQALATFLIKKSSPDFDKLVRLSIDLDDKDQSSTQDFLTF